MSKDFRQKIENNRDKIITCSILFLIGAVIIFCIVDVIIVKTAPKTSTANTQLTEQNNPGIAKQIEKYTQFGNDGSEGLVVDSYKSEQYPDNPGICYVLSNNEEYALIISDITGKPKDKNGKNIEISNQIKVYKSELIKDSISDKHIVIFLVKQNDIEIINNNQAQASEKSNISNEKEQASGNPNKSSEKAPISYDTGITYEQLARTPNDYKGKKAKFSGKVLQVIEGDKENDLRIAVDGNYDNVLFVGYDPKISSIRILENDSVTVKGTSIGIYSYESALGGKISIPGMWVDQIELNK